MSYSYKVTATPEGTFKVEVFDDANSLIKSGTPCRKAESAKRKGRKMIAELKKEAMQIAQAA